MTSYLTDFFCFMIIFNCVSNTNYTLPGKIMSRHHRTIFMRLYPKSWNLDGVIFGQNIQIHLGANHLTYILEFWTKIQFLGIELSSFLNKKFYTNELTNENGFLSENAASSILYLDTFSTITWYLPIMTSTSVILLGTVYLLLLT